MASHSRKGSKAEASLSTPPPEPSKSQSSDFDILSTYTSLLSTDPLLTKPTAAVSALLALLSHNPPSTVSETLSLLSHHSAILKDSISNPIALSAGTDLFQRYCVGVLQSPSTGPKNEGEDFKATREQLLENGRLFVQRAKEARDSIARTAKGFVGDGKTVLIYGYSRVVSAVLHAAADDGVDFRVICVQDLTSDDSSDMITQLKKKGVAVATIPISAVAYSRDMATFVMIGAESVVEDGGIISKMGTYQLAILAQSANKPVYVVAESHKFVRVYPLGQYDLPLRQMVVDFEGREEEQPGQGDAGKEKKAASGKTPRGDEELVDYTAPKFITSLVTETGIHTPSAVSEELIKIWY
ncbi:MAG: hypothetical protein Q9183_004996 [Haloplaca sp. 2 TL-2023]